MCEPTLPDSLALLEDDVPPLRPRAPQPESPGAPTSAAAALVPQTRTRRSHPSVEQPTLAHIRLGPGPYPDADERKGWPTFAKTTAKAESYQVAAVVEHARESMSGKRVRQLLKHMSTALLSYTFAFAKNNNAVEVQCMAVNGRLVVAGNSAQGMRELFEHLQSRGLIHVARAAMQLPEPREEGTSSTEALVRAEERQQQARQLRKLERVATTGQLGKPARSAAEAEADSPARQDARAAADLATLIAGAKESGLVELVQGESAAAERLRAKNSVGHVIVLAGGTCPHAEQNLMMILMKLGRETHATIQGVKRSCTACYLCLKLLTTKMGYRIDFSNEPGVAFAGGFGKIDAIFKSHLDEMQRQLDRSLEDADVHRLVGELLPTKRHVTKMDKHVSTTLDTLSDSEDER